MWGKKRRLWHGFPRPLSPLYRSIQLPAANAGFRRAFEEFGFLIQGVEFREIGGWGYVRVVPVGGKDRPAPPAWLMPLLVSIIPEMRRRAKRCVAAIRSNLHGRVVRRWREEWLPEMAARNAQLREVDLRCLSHAELDAHLQAAVKLFDDGYRIHFALQTALMVALGELAFFCRDELGWTDTETFDLLTGLSPTSTEPARQLEALARLAGSKPTLRAVLDGLKPAGRRPTREEIGRLRTIDAEFAHAFVGYLQEFGCRAVNHEAADATLEEDPDLLLGLVRDRLAARGGTTSDAAGLSARRAEARERAQTQLADLSARARFDRILSTAEEAYPRREENEFYTVSVPLALVRYAVLEAGRRLADRSQIGRPDDAFFLEMPELRDALREDRSYRELVLRREGERAWVEAHPGAPSFGKNPGPPPSFRKLTPEVRLAMEAVLWTVERTFESDRSAAPRTTDAGALTGIGASPGRYTGSVRIVFDESRLDRVRPGDVLVCPITSPVWSIVFPNVGALVTDTGGLLSHPAIIAREYAIPAVVATGNATTRLQDGQMVTVDGTEGVVEPA